MKKTHTFEKTCPFKLKKPAMAGLLTCFSLLSIIIPTTAQAAVNSQTADKFYMMINSHKVQLGDSLDDIEHQFGIAHDKKSDKKTNSDSLSWWFDNGLTLVAIFKEDKKNKNTKNSRKNKKDLKIFQPKPKKPMETANPEIIDVLGYGNNPKTAEQLEAEITQVIKERKAEKAEIAKRNKKLQKQQQEMQSRKTLSEIVISSSSQIPNSYMVAYGEKVTLNTSSIEQLESVFSDTYRCLSYFEQGNLGWVDFTVRDGKGKNYYANFSSINDSKHSLTEVEGLIETKQKLVDSVSMSKGLESHSTKVYCKDWYER